MPPDTRRTLLLAAEEESALNALRTRLRLDHPAVCGPVQELLRQVRRLRPDVLLLALDLPADRLGLLRTFQYASPRTQVVLVPVRADLDPEAFQLAAGFPILFAADR